MSAAAIECCDIEDDVKEALKRFRFRKHTSNAALILKINREKQLISIDEELEDVELEDLQEIIPSHQPRYIIYSFKLQHADGRASFPLCLVAYSPQDSQMELQLMYAGARRSLQAAAGLARSLDVRDLTDLTNDWLTDKLVR